MIPFKVYELEDNDSLMGYKVEPLIKPLNVKRWERTVRNLSKLVSTGKKQMVISPVKVLSERDLEEYRRYFCKVAKKIGYNCIYFEVPVRVSVTYK